MNFLARNEDRHFYLLGVWRDEGGAFIVSSVFLLPDGTKRADGGSYSFAIKEMAVEKCRRILSLKRKKRGYEQVRLTELPEPGKVFLKPSLGDYVTPEEMLRMVTEASRERYVEFEFATVLRTALTRGWSISP